MKFIFIISSILLTAFAKEEFLHPQPLATIFPSAARCIFTYGQCMQDLAICWRTQLSLDLTICDSFQDKCEYLYSSCRFVEIPIHSLPYEKTETEQCMAKFDKCLDLQDECQKKSLQMTTENVSPKLDPKCLDIVQRCRVLLNSCHNPGSVAHLELAQTKSTGYIRTWTPPETALEPTPTFLTLPAASQCLANYRHCISFHIACQAEVASYGSMNKTFLAEKRAKACYQILLRCKAHATSCAKTPPNGFATLTPTWIPDKNAQGVEIPAWIPAIQRTPGNERCIGGYQRCLILYRNCLMAATLMQDSGLFEKAEFHRNECEAQLIPLCKSGLEVCGGLKAV